MDKITKQKLIRGNVFLIILLIYFLYTLIRNDFGISVYLIPGLVIFASLFFVVNYKYLHHMDRKRKLMLILIVVFAFIISSVIFWFSFIGALNGAVGETMSFIEECPIPKELENQYESSRSEEDLKLIFKWCCENFDSSNVACLIP